MKGRSISAHTDREAPIRMLWLPGAYHAHADFLISGFAKAARIRHADLDLFFGDLEMDFIGDRALLERIRTEFVLPARAKGVQVWLGGISLGGLFALDYVDTHPGDIDRLCLLAPYLGNRAIIAEIAAARDLAAWQPGELAPGDVEHRIWRYLKNRGADAEALYLGYGRDDRFAPAHALMARGLSAACVKVIDGGHDWATWSKLWENFLDSHA